MKRTEAVVRTLASDVGARPVGSEANERACRYIEDTAEELGFAAETLSFDCLRWEHGSSSLALGGRTYEIHPAPFSPSVDGLFPVEYVSTVEELRAAEIAGKLLVIQGTLAEAPLMPKDFPFFYPDEHKEIVDLIQRERPAGVLALTGKHPACGWDPFPLFEDGNLGVPNAFISRDCELVGVEGVVKIDSSAPPAKGRQLVLSRGPAGGVRLVLCAHMDTKYGTPGALDNAAGVATLVGVMERLRDAELLVAVDIVPFNGEEHFAVPGQLAYLAHRSAQTEAPALVVNVDGIGHIASKNAFSYYNLTEEQSAEINTIVERADSAVAGEQWIAGDHAVFVFQGVPCVAVTSSNLMETVLDLTHTKEDTVDRIKIELIEAAADTIAEIVCSAP